MGPGLKKSKWAYEHLLKLITFKYRIFRYRHFKYNIRPLLIDIFIIIDHNVTAVGGRNA